MSIGRVEKMDAIPGWGVLWCFCKVRNFTGVLCGAVVNPRMFPGLLLIGISRSDWFHRYTEKKMAYKVLIRSEIEPYRTIVPLLEEHCQVHRWNPLDAQSAAEN